MMDLPLRVNSTSLEYNGIKLRFTTLTVSMAFTLVKPLNPESDQYLISPYNNTAKSFIKIIRIKEIISRL